MMLRVRLLYNERVLHEISTDGITEELEIGRSSSCGWQTPAEDMVVGSRHAVLLRQGEEVVLRDTGSKNGTWYRGRRIDQRKLKAGDQIAIGRCVLRVDEQSGKVAGPIVSEIVVLTGKQRNQRKAIIGSQFTIGTDPQSDLLFLDDLVSRQHAVILRKDDGGLWLKDLDSTNGTRVNDVPLRPRQERLLKDGDRVAVAHMEFMFHDGSGPREQGKAVLKLGILVGIALLVGGLYFGVQLAKPSAVALVERAGKLAQAGRFPEARYQLDKAVGSYRYGDCEEQANFVRRQINSWETTFKQWQQVQGHLREQKWPLAARELGGLLSLPSDCWGWEDGPSLRKSAGNLKRVLDTYLDATRPDIPLDVLTAKYATLTDVVREIEAEKELEGLHKIARERLEQLRSQIETYRRLVNALQGLETWPLTLDTSKVVAEVESIAKSSEGALRQRAEMVLQPLRRLAAAYSQLGKAVQLAHEMRFKELANFKVDMPAADDCGIDGRLNTLRTNLDNSYVNLRRQVSGVEALVSALSQEADSASTVPSQVRCWSDSAYLAKVFACDSLNGPLPRRTRTEPWGEYDRAVCVEQFYAGLRAIIEQRDNGSGEAPFESVLTHTIRTVAIAKRLSTYLGDPQHQWLKGGLLGRWGQCAERILETRNKIVHDMMNSARQSSGRKAVIAAGIAWQLLDSPEREKIGDQPFREWLTATLLGVRREVESLEREQESASVEGRIQLRKRILEIGLPGDPIVQRMWQQAAEAPKP